jgi:hypothetical protein
MFGLTELRTVAKDKDGNAQLGVFAMVDISAGTVIWRETHKRRAYFSKEWIASASHAQIKRLERFGFTAEDNEGHLAVFAWIEPWVRGDVKDLPLEHRLDNGDFFNHSCDPNTWWIDNYTIVARRNIKRGEELCYDYATEDEYVSPFNCFCGAECCRLYIGGQEWRRTSLHEAYGPHFKLFLREKIRCHYYSSNISVNSN